MLYFFFFKQKTAYEMRISDWSSDVCSSDLCDPVAWEPPVAGGLSAARRGARPCRISGGAARPRRRLDRRLRAAGAAARRCLAHADRAGALDRRASRCAGAGRRGAARACRRSEEHTSELQSLMRTSYAVFCLKKKTKQK